MTPESGESFQGLSIADLLTGRDLFHRHLAHMENVVATAIGRYRGRAEGVDPASPKTLTNTRVNSWSWPCVLVFVTDWIDKAAFGQIEHFVPPYLYLPDGRSIPTCVIQVNQQDVGSGAPESMSFPSLTVGGGYPVVLDEQGQTHFASIGCLVTDGHTTYALTNAHVTGDAGQVISTVMGGKVRRLGVSDARRLTRMQFDQVYPDWHAANAYVNLDAGLVRIDDLDNWTAQVFGIGALGLLKDLNPDTYSLQLIGAPVRAFGAGSGLLVGEISALFYRYRSVGGFDYIADLLIGPRAGSVATGTHQGDSGTLWVLEEAPSRAVGEEHGQLRPIALQWGGHKIVSPDATGQQQQREFSFALASALATVLRELNIDIIRDWNTGHPETWGTIGHYLIGARACGAVANASLKALLANNKDRISVSDDDIRTRDLNKQPGFIALADVADVAWRKPGGRPADAHNHFADMDLPGVGAFNGKTLMDLTRSAADLDPNTWNSFYDLLHTEEAHKGVLPFRVWQMYNDMVTYVSAGKVTEFVCTAGVLAHYLGDACQPLHVSRFHHGYGVDAGSTDPAHPLPNGISTSMESNVHAVFEEQMLEHSATAELIAKVDAILKRRRLAHPHIVDGRTAAWATVGLMKRTLKVLSPLTIVDTYNSAVLQIQHPADRVTHMWDVLGDQTAGCMAEGVLTLAAIWQAAWEQGKGDAITSLNGVDREGLRRLYTNLKFAQSVDLVHLSESGLLTPHTIDQLVTL